MLKSSTRPLRCVQIPRHLAAAGRPDLRPGGPDRRHDEHRERRRSTRAARAATRSPARTASRARPSSEWDDFDGAGDDSHPGLRHRHQRQRRAADRLQDRHRRPQLRITIYRLGYYGGDGARQIATVVAVGLAAADTSRRASPTSPPSCTTAATGRSRRPGTCRRRRSPASTSPSSTATDTGDSSHITFIVRDDSSHSDVVFQTSDTTWQAYNDYGGSSFYHGGANGRPTRSATTAPSRPGAGSGGRDFFFANEYPMVRFLERNGYDVSYLAGVDSDRCGALLQEPQDLPVRRARRVLERGAARQRRGRARRRA